MPEKTQTKWHIVSLFKMRGSEKSRLFVAVEYR